MAIPDYARTNFDTLRRAAAAGELALMECADASTGEPRYVICAVHFEGTEYTFTPFGHLASENPYDLYVPPKPGTSGGPAQTAGGHHVDRVSASIILGGTMTVAHYADLTQIIVNEGLSIEWGGEPFELHHRTVGAPLSLYAHEVPYGRFETLEAWCVEKHLPFARWSGSCPGQWGAERLVFTGQHEPVSSAAD